MKYTKETFRVGNGKKEEGNKKGWKERNNSTFKSPKSFYYLSGL